MPIKVWSRPVTKPVAPLFTKLAAEFVGTAVLMVFGHGAVANAELKNTNPHFLPVLQSDPIPYYEQSQLTFLLNH